MDADERLTALKRAYADIILNTAKEAAARIIVSERKALRSQQELNATKEQALQMLIRLKQMMDSKISEAEVTSLSQQRKIEVLESQLQEAEDIVKDLREELREVQSELEKVRDKKLQPNVERDTAPQQQTSQENGFHTSQSIIFPPRASPHEFFTTSDMKNSTVNQQNEVSPYYNGDDYHVGNSYTVGEPDLFSKSEENRPSIAQSVVFPLSGLPDESFTAPDMKSSAFNQSNEVYKCHAANDLCREDSNVSKPVLPSILYRNRRSHRIRAFEEKLMAGGLAFSERINVVNYERSGREDGEGEGICRTPVQKSDNMCTVEKNDVQQAPSSWHQVQNAKSSRRKKARATRCRRKKTPSYRYLTDQVPKRDQTSDFSLTEANSTSYRAQSSGDPDKSTLVKCTNVAESDEEFVKAGSVQNTENEDQASTSKLLLMRPGSGSAENTGVPICIRDVDVEREDLPVVNSEIEISGTSNEIPNQPVTDRVIKYTFQRKRKKESLSSSDGNANLEKAILKKKAAEKQNDIVQTEKASLITESSRDSRRVAQVARQLISLSEKKWWQ